MTWVWIVLSGLCLIAGLVGCVVPVIPGPLMCYASLLLLIPLEHASPSLMMLVVCGAVVLLATVLDYVVPAMGAKKFKCSTWGVVGCTLGTIIGVFFFPLGIILGPFLGAVVGELIAGKNGSESLKGGFGAFLGFLVGVMLKLGVCVFLAFVVFKSVFQSFAR